MSGIQVDGTKHPCHVVLSCNQIWPLEPSNFLCKTPKFFAQGGDKANRCGGNILESQKHLGQKEFWEVVWYNSPLRAGPGLTLEQVPQGHVQSSAVYLKGWRFHSFSGKLVPGL